MKNKLLKDIKKFPEEYEQIQNILNERQKLKDDYPFTFLDNDKDLKEINLYRRFQRNNTNDKIPFFRRRKVI